MAWRWGEISTKEEGRCKALLERGGGGVLGAFVYTARTTCVQHAFYREKLGSFRAISNILAHTDHTTPPQLRPMSVFAPPKPGSDGLHGPSGRRGICQPPAMICQPPGHGSIAPLVEVPHGKLRSPQSVSRLWSTAAGKPSGHSGQCSACCSGPCYARSNGCSPLRKHHLTKFPLPRATVVFWNALLVDS